MRESPTLDIIELLRAKGAEVRYHDPYVPAFAHNGHRLNCEPDLDQAVVAADCVVVTDHSAYDWGRIQRTAKRVVDTRHVLNGSGAERDCVTPSTSLPLPLSPISGR
ncbi:MAG: hypothetical protein AMXMBFR16_11770 [Candidatus Uhrbacteria bacterium]